MLRTGGGVILCGVQEVLVQGMVWGWMDMLEMVFTVVMDGSWLLLIQIITNFIK